MRQGRMRWTVWATVVLLAVSGLLSLTSCGGGGGGSIGGAGGSPSGGIQFTATVTSPAGTRTFNANTVTAGLGVDVIGVMGGVVGDLGIAFAFRRPSQIPTTIIFNRQTWLDDEAEARVVFVIGGTGEEFSTRMEGGSGTLRITTLTDNRIAGTFQITAKSIYGTGTTVTASGSFNLPKGTWTFINGQWVGGL